MAAEIESAAGVAPVLIEGRGGIFEVAVDGRLVFSKKSAGRFPNPDEILKLLRP